MNVLYDFQAFKQRYGGISRYHYELLKLIPQLDKSITVELPHSISDNHYLNIDPAFNKVDLQKTIFRKPFKGRDFVIELYNKYKSLQAIGKNQFDIFHPTYIDPYFVKRLKKPLVVTVHDFTHEKFGTKYNKIDIENKKILIKRADKLIAISHNTKNDLLEIYPEIPESKIEVIYHGFTRSETVTDKSQIENDPLSGKAYLLYVGKRTGYKNFQFFFNAIAPILKENKDLLLVCAGIPFTKPELLLFESAGLADKLVAIGATDQHLKQLYTNAIAFVFPSLYEGFGIPILEAFSNNCPTILSNASCFPEIATDAAAYFEPTDAASIYQTVNKVLFDKELQNKMKATGTERVKSFTWEATAKNTLNLYHQIA